MIRIPATAANGCWRFVSAALAVALLLLFTGGVAQASPTAYVTSQSSDADLSGLTVSVGTLSPAFTPASHAYTVTVGANTSAIALTPTAHEAHATITVNGTPAVSGSAASKALQMGDNVFTIVVTAQDGTTTQTYTLTVHRMSNVATLSSLTFGQGTLSPAFSRPPRSTRSACRTAPRRSSFTPTPTSAYAMVKYQGRLRGAGPRTARPRPSPGHWRWERRRSPSRSSRKTASRCQVYQVRVNRAASSPTDADLYGLAVNHGALSPAFGPHTDAYTVAVPYTVSSLSLTPTADDGSATLTVNGDPVASGTAAGATLDVGDHVFTVAVTAQDGTTMHTYTVTVTRAAPSHGRRPRWPDRQPRDTLARVRPGHQCVHGRRALHRRLVQPDADP